MRVLLLALPLLLAPSVVRADRLDACLEAAVSEMEGHGAALLGEPWVGFLREGQRHSMEHVLSEDGCVGFLAFGHRRVQDLDLTLHTSSGIELARDVEVDARPYVRYCGAAGLELVVGVEMYKGRGELRLLSFSNAPPTLPDLNRTIGRCFATAGGVRRPPADVGPEPPGRSVADAVSHLAGELRETGYRPMGGVEQRGSLGERQRVALSVQLPNAGCYAVAAVGGSGVIDLDLHLRSSDRRDLGRDEARERNALVRLCVSGPTAVVADVRMFQGSGEYALERFALDEPSDLLPPGAEGLSRIGWRELSLVLARRGMHATALGWGYAMPGRSLTMPVHLVAGKCYAFGAARSEELRGSDLDLTLQDAEGGLVAWDLGSGEPLLFHCPEHTGPYRLVGRAYGGRGRYLVVLGEEP